MALAHQDLYLAHAAKQDDNISSTRFRYKPFLSLLFMPCTRTFLRENVKTRKASNQISVAASAENSTNSTKECVDAINLGCQ